MNRIKPDSQLKAVTDFLAQLRKHIGLSFGAEKRYLVESRLSPLAQKAGFTNVHDLLIQLNTSVVGELHWQCFETMTTQETQFFRDGFFFETLRKEILPALIQKRQGEKKLKIWSAAVSTGQEAYSLAIFLEEQFPELKSWKIQILATDVSDKALQVAQRGEYEIQDLERGLSPLQITRFFTKGPVDFQIAPWLREAIQFQKINLISAWPAESSWDLILMRNVLIYFDQSTKNKVLEKVSQALAADEGTLVLGSSETLIDFPKLVRRSAARGFFYQRQSVEA